MKLIHLWKGVFNFSVETQIQDPNYYREIEFYLACYKDNPFSGKIFDISDFFSQASFVGKIEGDTIYFEKFYNNFQGIDTETNQLFISKHPYPKIYYSGNLVNEHEYFGEWYYEDSHFQYLNENLLIEKRTGTFRLFTRYSSFEK